jgi:hypothetical protein
MAKNIQSKSAITKTSFDIPSSLKTSFKLKAVANGTDMKEVIIKLIKAYVNKKIKLDKL